MTKSEANEMTYDEYLEAMLRMMEEPIVSRNDNYIIPIDTLEGDYDLDDDYELA